MNRLATILLALLLGTSAMTVERALAAQRLKFLSVEANGEQFTERLLATDAWLRIDGEGQDGFVLFDRKEGSIYSVNVPGRQIIVIPPFEGAIEPPIELVYAAYRVEEPDAPLIGGVQPVHMAYEVNGRICYEAIFVPGLLDEVRQAEAAYLRALAAEQRSHVGRIPADRIDACDLARHAFAADRHFSGGYPIMVWDDSGTRRELLGFDTDVTPDPALFLLPDGFDRVDMSTLR